MKVVLLENIDGLGLKGEVKNVSDGYASNFLLPHKKAVLATAKNVNRMEAKANKAEAQVQEQTDNYSKIAKTLDKQSINFSGKVSDKDTLFKGVSTSDIIAEVKSKFNLEISDNWFVKPSLLKELGRHSIFLRLPNNKVINFFVNIKAI